jgi:hypothetical protein
MLLRTRCWAMLFTIAASGFISATSYGQQQSRQDLMRQMIKGAIMDRSIVALLSLVLIWLPSFAIAAPVSQVDQIQLSGRTYHQDTWTLSISSPIIADVTYTATFGDEAGCNICNVTVHWGEAINDDPVISTLLAASYLIWDGVSSYDPIITLTSLTPGVPFTASVSVLDFSNDDGSFEDEPPGVSIVTVTAAFADPIPEPDGFAVFALALGLLGASQLRRRHSERGGLSHGLSQ